MDVRAFISTAVWMMTLQTLIKSSEPLETRHYRVFPECNKNWASNDSTITSLSVSVPSMCAMSCMQTKTCLSYNICEDGNMSVCHLIPSIKLNRCSGLIAHSRCIYMEKQGNPCQNGGTWTSNSCHCVDGYAGTYCERYIRSCQEGWDLGVRVRRFYMVQPFGSPVAYRLFCNLQYSETAYMFVRKRNPSCPRLNFDKSWKEYREGFGDPDCGEYFIGLETMHQLMKYESFQVHVYGQFIENAVIEEINYFYNGFTVLSEVGNYKMNYVDTYTFPSSRAGDGLGSERPRDFCTRDRDCGSCAVSNGGAWWYSGGCGGHPMTSTLNKFVWPIDSTDTDMEEMFFQLNHMHYLS